MKKMLLILMGIVSVGLCGCSVNSENEEQRTAEATSGITAGTGQNEETQNGTAQSETKQSIIEEGGMTAAVKDNTSGSSGKTLQDGSLPDAYKEILDSVYEVLLGKEADDVAGGELIGVGVWEARIGRTVEEILSCVGYTLYDVDGNGVQELIIADTGEGLWDNRILNMYTLHEDEPVMVLEGWARNRLYILNDGRIYYEGSGGAAYTTFATYRMGADGRSLEPIDYYFTDYPDDTARVTEWFHNTIGEEDVKKSEIMELENDDVPWKMQEEFEAQVMPLDLMFFSGYH